MVLMTTRLILEYPKIETLYERDAKTFKVTDALRLPEFDLVKSWLVTEKIDGTNIRVLFEVGGEITFGGRTDAAQMPTFLLKHLQDTFTQGRLANAFEPGVKGVLYGEGYGAKIQKGGGNYRPDSSFRLFDVLIHGADRPWWLNWTSVEDIAAKLSIETAPVILRSATIEEARAVLRDGSRLAATENGAEVQQEGIVARTEPLLMTRNGHRLMWKLKAKDY